MLTAVNFALSDLLMGQNIVLRQRIDKSWLFTLRYSYYDTKLLLERIFAKRSGSDTLYTKYILPTTESVKRILAYTQLLYLLREFARMKAKSAVLPKVESQGLRKYHNSFFFKEWMIHYNLFVLLTERRRESWGEDHRTAAWNCRRIIVITAVYRACWLQPVGI